VYQDGNGQREGSSEVVVHNIRFYQVFLVALDPQIQTASSLLTPGQAPEQPPLVFRFSLESMEEPTSEDFGTETTEMLNRLSDVKNEFATRRESPASIIQEIFYTLVADEPQRAVKVEGSLFSAEYEPPPTMYLDETDLLNNVN
tara:strand:+ start:1767 stop:2198 length:432 start_codon:yes stop_codon:yes gene_type:complete